MDYSSLHAPISNAERIALIGDWPLAQVVSAPGHRTLRRPDAVRAIAAAMREGRLQGVVDEPILIGLFTEERDGEVRLRAVECLDGHHRLLAGLLSGVWTRLGDIPPAALDTRVNGWRADGTSAEPRWIPLEAARRSSLAPSQWSEVPAEWGAKGPTAAIPGGVCSLDPAFDPVDRGMPLGDLLKAVLD